MPGGNLTRNTAAQVARVMELDHVDYDLENWKGFLCSVCKLFTSEQESFVPAYVAYPFQKPQEFLRNAKDSSFYEPLLDLLVFDAVIANQDRHFGNLVLFGTMLVGNYCEWRRFLITVCLFCTRLWRTI